VQHAAWIFVRGYFFGDARAVEKSARSGELCKTLEEAGIAEKRDETATRGKMLVEKELGNVKEIGTRLGRMFKTKR
jgi:hypothetical protein